MPGFYIRPMFDRKIFSGIFLWGGQGNAPLPSPTPMAGPQAPHQLNPALVPPKVDWAPTPMPTGADFSGSVGESNPEELGG